MSVDPLANVERLLEKAICVYVPSPEVSDAWEAVRLLFDCVSVPCEIGSPLWVARERLLEFDASLGGDPQ